MDKHALLAISEFKLNICFFACGMKNLVAYAHFLRFNRLRMRNLSFKVPQQKR
jgi:hypothetical protein